MRHEIALSILVPTKNETRTLGRCLDAISGWADQIVVVDSQSDDGTVELAESYDAEVVQFRYQGGWPKKRQWALDNHTWRHEWVLLLDADEILNDRVKAEIEAAIKDTNYNGYWLRFPPVFLGRTLRFGDSQLRKLSLFRLGKGRYETRLEAQDVNMADMEVHEHVVVDGPTRCLRTPVRHETLTALDRYIEKHNAYSNWEARVLLEGTDAEMKATPWGNQAQRRRWLKTKLLGIPGSPLLRFLYIYGLRGGFLDGRAGLLYATFKFIQTCHVKAKIYELRQAGRGPQSRAMGTMQNQTTHDPADPRDPGQDAEPLLAFSPFAQPPVASGPGGGGSRADTDSATEAAAARAGALIPDVRRRIEAGLDWLCRSQDATNCGGSAAYYAPLLGWSAPYPETSGYIIPTLWRGEDLLGDRRYGARAMKMANWLLAIQSNEGWFPGGMLKPGGSVTPSVFNTSQILFGLVEAAERTHDASFAEAARRAAYWLVDQQDDDGRWRAHAYAPGYSPSYYAQLCWALFEYWRYSQDLAVRACAERGLHAVLSDRTSRGTFRRWGFAEGKPAFTHTIGYTLQGLAESALIADQWQPFGDAATEASEILLKKYEVRHQLAGMYDTNWNGDFRFKCLTGNCQIALTWLCVYKQHRDPRFLNGAAKLILDTCRHQSTGRLSRKTTGAIPGSTPFYGPYLRFRYPNWATKFFVDAAIETERMLGTSAERPGEGLFESTAMPGNAFAGPMSRAA